MRYRTATKAALVLLYLESSVAPSEAVDPRFRASLLKLDPQTRLEQVCDIAAMERIKREQSSFQPDRAKSYVAAPPRHAGHTLTAAGAAFRSKGRWYALSFTCKGSTDHTSVVSFEYRIGKAIPDSKWSEYGLWR